MPAILTHYFFSKKIQLQSSQEIKNVLENHSDIFSLGSQGPDVLYFNFLNKKAVSLGKIIHQNGVSSFFKACIQYVLKTEGDKRDILFSYLAGFLSHYTLDACAHPYIFYKSGFSDETGSLGGVYSQRHHYFETALDSLLCKKYTGKSPAQVKLWKKMHCSGDKKNLIAEMYKYAVRSAYGIRLSKRAYVKSFNRFYGFYKSFNDKHGIKTVIISKIEAALRFPGYISSLIHFSNITNVKEYLNLKKEPWILPWDENAVFNTNFLEIMDGARNKCLDSVKFLFDTVYNGSDAPILLYILGDLSLVTGLDCMEKVEFIFMENKGI